MEATQAVPKDVAGHVYASMSMSLDGFVAGPNDGPDNGLGDGGEQLHEWLFDLKSWREPHGIEGGQDSVESDMFEEGFGRAGAIIIGRRMFDNAETAWGEEPPFHRPVFIVTHRKRETEEKKGGTRYIFVTDGIESALSQAREQAGAKDVSVAGANTIQQFINAGLLDELEVDLVPIILGGGVPLFANLDPSIRFEKTRVVEGPAVTHIQYRVVKEGS